MWRTVDLIYSKRQGEALDPNAIEWLIREYVAGRVPDYQIAALLMAIFFRGMETEELGALVNAMMRSGEVFDWSKVEGVKADKHSTGGVGDKVSLPLAPIAAACGLVVPMVSGRGLGHTGGTLDKLESIKGFDVRIPTAQVRRQLKTIGVAMIGQSDKFVPADRKLYALRDVTATVESIPLICASIMSKKLAEGAEVLVLDIKTGNGAFMKNPADAKKLGRMMIELGQSMGRKVAALLTDMNQPLGRAIGHANEMIESIECLRGTWPDDLKKVTYELTGQMLVAGGLAKDMREAEAKMDAAVASGAAMDVLRKLIEVQGGDPRVVDEPTRLKIAPKEVVIKAPRDGYVASFETRQIGIAAALLGAGRPTKESEIDHSVSLYCEKKIGDRVTKGEPVFTVRYRSAKNWPAAEKMLQESFAVSEAKVKAPKLIGGWL